MVWALHLLVPGDCAGCPCPDVKWDGTRGHVLTGGGRKVRYSPEAILIGAMAAFAVTGMVAISMEREA